MKKSCMNCQHLWKTDEEAPCQACIAERRRPGVSYSCWEKLADVRVLNLWVVWVKADDGYRYADVYPTRERARVGAQGCREEGFQTKITKVEVEVPE